MSHKHKYCPSVLRFLLIFVLLSFLSLTTSLTAIASTVRWVVLPKYDYLGSYCDGVYVFVERGTMGLIDDSGGVIDGSQCDSITPASSKGWALLLRDVGSSEAALVGIFNCKKRQVIHVDDDLKINLDFAFFNDDRLPVHDNDGNWGYLGIDGKLSIPCKYMEAWPFSMQRAPVRLRTKTKNVVYIKDDGTRITLLVNDGMIGDGTPIFQDGTADVTLNGKHSRITRNGKVIKSRISKTELRGIDTWLSEYRQSIAENVVLPSSLDSAMLSFFESEDGRIISQQLKILSTQGNQAIVGYKEKMGILQLVQGGFDIYPTSSNITIKDGEIDPQVLKFDLSIPGGFSPQDLDYYINGYGAEPTPQGNGSQEFQVNTLPYADLKSSIVDTITVEVKHHGLLLFKEERRVSITVEQIDPQIVTPSPKPDPPKPRTCPVCGEIISKCPHNGKHKPCQKCGKIVDKGHRVPGRCSEDGKHRTPPPT